MKLRTDFDAAITSHRSSATLDPSIAELREKISEEAFIEPFSIYSRSQLRKMTDWLGYISTARLKDSPWEVAGAVYWVLQLLDDLEFSVKQSEASKSRITASQRPAPAALV